MIEFEKFELDNGLKVIFHQDLTTPMAVVDIVYNVGARDENENRTGFAHLFEHLMFGGSKNIENFDAPLQMAGGECNAFTNNDITNYYDILPAQNLETALWLESDRMLELAFTPKSLEVQRNVVIEEFKQRYLNQPYGDVWLELRPLIYQQHPYKWATIGKNIDHIADATMEDVKSFFFKHYSPSNATMVIGGNLDFDEVKELVIKWFGDIPAREKYERKLSAEPAQNEKREKTIVRDVPSDAIYMAFRMAERTSPDFYVGDLVSDLLGRGKSSRFFQELITEKKLFTQASAYVSGGWEDGLFIVSGQLTSGVSFSEAEEAIWLELNKLHLNPIDERELTKVKNKFKTSKVFSEQPLMNRVMNIALFDMMGKLDEVNNELQKYDAVTSENIKNFAKYLLIPENSSTLKIKAK
ncbi:insulinase family protein [Paracrocinitomix mangrovi]|uniref:M16 family metallopeptidase n=1 Tax=Paracrocinitomix mangrovi TaxID=2862509 RepID=UPI001C8D0CDA|nr:pitrilysin family protein [Paracrocinitomix mangrovi]UKN01578.1 insulinase family protein [Paracrocinitomix mangrovi]